MNQSILVIDRDSTNREFVAEALTRNGYQVATVDNAYEAISAVARYAPSLILLDVEIPIMAGLSFLQLYNRVPEPRADIIAMTSNDMTFEKAVAQRVKGYLEKPIERKELLRVVAKHLPKLARAAGAAG